MLQGRAQTLYIPKDQGQLAVDDEEEEEDMIK